MLALTPSTYRRSITLCIDDTDRCLNSESFCLTRTGGITGRTEVRI
jgi:hypothetical protein